MTAFKPSLDRTAKHLIISPSDGEISLDEALARFDRCAAADGKVSGALPPETQTTAVLLHGWSSSSPSRALLASLFALIMCLPTRRVRVRIDPESRTVHVAERGLFHRARIAEFALDDLVAVELEGEEAGASAGSIVLRSLHVPPLRLTDRDWRPIELKRRTANRLRAFLASARARE